MDQAFAHLGFLHVTPMWSCLHSPLEGVLLDPRYSEDDVPSTEGSAMSRIISHKGVQFVAVEAETSFPAVVSSGGHFRPGPVIGTRVCKLVRKN